MEEIDERAHKSADLWREVKDRLKSSALALSGGQQQRLCIARALANRPAVVFADEPTANLDSKTADEILELMRALNEERGGAFLFATHDPRVVARAKRVISLVDGRIEWDR